MEFFPASACFVILAIALYTDIKQRKIPNLLTLTAAVSGILFHFINGSGQGISYGAEGLLLGTALLFIPFLMGGMGGGDVKLLAALGSWLGPSGVLDVFFLWCFHRSCYRAFYDHQSRRAVPLKNNLH